MIVYEVKLVCQVTKKVHYFYVGEKIKLPTLEETKKFPQAQLVISTVSNSAPVEQEQPKAA